MRLVLVLIWQLPSAMLVISHACAISRCLGSSVLPFEDGSSFGGKPRETFSSERVYSQVTSCLERVFAMIPTAGLPSMVVCGLGSSME